MSTFLTINPGSRGRNCAMMIRAGVVLLATFCLFGVPAAQGQAFPAAGDDSFTSKAKLSVTVVGPGGTTTLFVVTVQDQGSQTVILRSNPHTDLGAAPDTSGPLGAGTSGCSGDPKPGNGNPSTARMLGGSTRHQHRRWMRGRNQARYCTSLRRTRTGS